MTRALSVQGEVSFNRDKKVIQNLLGDEFEREKEIIWTSPHGTKIVAHVDLYHGNPSHSEKCAIMRTKEELEKCES